MQRVNAGFRRLEKFIRNWVNLPLDVSFRNEIPSWLSRVVLVTLVDATVSTASTVLRVVLPFVKRLTYSSDDVTREESKI